MGDKTIREESAAVSADEGDEAEKQQQEIREESDTVFVEEGDEVEEQNQEIREESDAASTDGDEAAEKQEGSEGETWVLGVWLRRKCARIVKGGLPRFPWGCACPRFTRLAGPPGACRLPVVGRKRWYSLRLPA